MAYDEHEDDRVARGAALLDEQVPGWERRIDPDRLDVTSACGCILGQVFGSYDDGCRQLQLGVTDDELFEVDTLEAARHGFETYGLSLYVDLQDAWDNMLATRVLSASA